MEPQALVRTTSNDEPLSPALTLLKVRLAVAEPEMLQGYLEGSNVTPLREMVDLVVISRAYEANQKIITTVDQQMQKTLEALG